MDPWKDAQDRSDKDERVILINYSEQIISGEVMKIQVNGISFHL